MKKGKNMPEVFVYWENDGIQEEMWQSKKKMMKDYHELFKDECEVQLMILKSSTNSFEVGKNCNTPRMSQLRKT